MNPALKAHVLICCPSGVYPARSGGHMAILESARFLARSGLEVVLFCYGVRRFEALSRFRSFRRVIEPGLTEYRHVSLWVWIDFLRRGRRGLPPVRAAEYVRRGWSPAVGRLFSQSGVTIFESPWLFPLHAADKPAIFVAHNVEVDLARETLGRRLSKTSLKEMAALEAGAWSEADAAVCLTEEDREKMSLLYGARSSSVIPVGVDTNAMRPLSDVERMETRRRLGVDGKFVVLFTGSWHPPNLQALKRVRAMAAAGADPEILWVAAGSVGRAPERSPGFLQTGPLSDLSAWLQAADCAVNPLLEGSGLNVKMLHYFAHGLPVVTTPFGARGLRIRDGVEAIFAPPERFARTKRPAPRGNSLFLGGRGAAKERAGAELAFAGEPSGVRAPGLSSISPRLPFRSSISGGCREIAVETQVGCDHRIFGEETLHPCSRLLPHRTPTGKVPAQRLAGFRKRLDIMAFTENPAFPILNHFGQAAVAGGDDRQTAGHGFDGDQTVALQTARKEQGIGLLIQPRQLRIGAQASHATAVFRQSMSEVPGLAVRGEPELVAFSQKPKQRGKKIHTFSR